MFDKAAVDFMKSWVHLPAVAVIDDGLRDIVERDGCHTALLLGAVYPID
jgi:hypothetical protein